MATDTNSNLQDDDLFAYRSLQDAHSKVRLGSLRGVVEDTAGLDLKRDQRERLVAFSRELERLESAGKTDVTANEFERLLRTGGRVLQRTLRGELIIPDFHIFRAKVETIFEEVRVIDPVGAEPKPPTKPPRLAVFDSDY